MVCVNQALKRQGNGMVCVNRALKRQGNSTVCVNPPLRNKGLRNQFNMGLGDATGEVTECVRSTICTPVTVIHSEHKWCEQFQKFILQNLNYMQKWNLFQWEIISIQCCGTLAEFNVCSACVKVILCFLPNTFQHFPVKIPNNLYSEWWNTNMSIDKAI
jgi:hypothetical protein